MRSPRAVAMIVALLLLSLAWPAPSPAQQANQIVRLTVRGNNWTNTDIVLAEGDRLIIQARRIAQERPNAAPQTQQTQRTQQDLRNSYGQQTELRERASPLANLSLAALQGKIANKTFLIGGKYDRPAPAVGRLSLRVKLSIGFSETGRLRADDTAFAVTVTRIPAPVIVPTGGGKDDVTINDSTDINTHGTGSGLGDGFPPMGNDAAPPRDTPTGNETAVTPPTENVQAAAPEENVQAEEPGGNQSVAAAADTTEPPPPPPPPADEGNGGWALIAAIVVLALLAAAVLAGLAVQHARLVKTKGLLSLSPSVDFGQSGLAIGAIPPAAPEARLRARLEMGRTIRAGPIAAPEQGVGDG